MVKKKDQKVRCSFTASANVANTVRSICKERGITVGEFIKDIVSEDAGFISFCKRGVTRHKANGGK